jgi:hypothetical protein
VQKLFYTERGVPLMNWKQYIGKSFGSQAFFSNSHFKLAHQKSYILLGDQLKWRE